MNTKTAIWAEVDQTGRLVLPPEVAARPGLQPGAEVRLDEGANDLRIHRPVAQLAKVYIEPTNRCNLACRTCMRNSWDVKMGQMREAIFSRIMAGLRAIAPAPSVFFGGLGEPLAHPRTIEMIARVKALGSTTEIITNGTLLDETRARGLIEAGLDVLWVSIDGATPESCADIRLGAALPEVTNWHRWPIPNIMLWSALDRLCGFPLRCLVGSESPATAVIAPVVILCNCINNRFFDR